MYNQIIHEMHGMGLLGKGDVWMNVANPKGFYNIGFKELTKSPKTEETGTNNFYVHTYNNTAIIDSGHSFPQITTAETRIIVMTIRARMLQHQISRLLKI